MSEPTPTMSTQGGGGDDLLAQLADDYLRRHRAGERPSIDEYAKNHAELAERIRDLFPAVIAMERPHVAAMLDPAPSAERIGATIGRYKLLERIGEGGFGVVYMAEQLHPVRRKVALKVVKPGMDSRQVLARFDAERQALAIMDHPNIAKVFDGGVTDSGRPYFVMELVKGEPITSYCDANHLAPRQRLELFVQVCDAVQHAHQKGIIHRDIKPTNVLVSMHDTTPVVKVIDFGVAKALGQELTERTLFTGFAQLLGTPLYMSPEQAGQSGLDVDTRSDIYSLGVLLYELLTGTTPFDKERFRKAAQDEIRRIIREEEPPRPSTRLIESKNSLASISAQRHTEPAKLTKLVRGDLDWIVMKALEKDRSRRYETANGLARDVERYLHDEAVQACPPSAAYRLRKFARRNKGPVLAATVVLLTLVGGIVGTTIGLVRATRAEALARTRLANERDAREQADAARKEAVAGRQAAQTEAAKAVAVSSLLQEMLSSAHPDAAKGANFTVRELLDQFSTGLSDQLQDQPEVEATLRQIIGSAYTRLRLPDKAEPHLRRSLLLNRQIFGEDHVKYADSLRHLARNLWVKASSNEVERLARQALAIYHNGNHPAGELEARWLLVLNLCGESRPEEAETIAEEALQHAREHRLENHSDFPNMLHHLSYIKNGKGDNASALRLARESTEIHLRIHGEMHHETGWGWFYFGIAHKSDGNLREAESCLRKSLGIFRKSFAAGDARNVGRAVVELLEVLEAQNNLAAVNELRREHPPETLAAAFKLAALVEVTYRRDEKRAIALSRKAIQLVPNGSHANELAWYLATHADPQFRDPATAVELARVAVDVQPTVGRYWNTLGVARYRAGDCKAAIADLEKSMELHNGGDSFDWFFLAMSHWQLGNKDEARQWYDRAVGWMERNVPANEQLTRFRAEAAELGMTEKK
jgi:serine/threonine protein kinase/tetratricopeptide (TPR) repeat protein